MKYFYFVHKNGAIAKTNADVLNDAFVRDGFRVVSRREYLQAREKLRGSQVSPLKQAGDDK